jgi:hypothetical protein
MRMPPSRPKASARSMVGLLRELIQIVTLRGGPANLPSTWASVAVFALLYAAVDVMIILMDDGYRVVARTAFDLALSLAVIGFLLAVTGRLHRMPQTLVAVYGAYALLSPAMAVLLLAGLPAESNQAIALFATAGSVLIVLWYLLIVGHVLRAALDTGLVTGFAIAVTWTIGSIALSQALFGGAA